jgi:hypothetical protein
MEAKPALIHHAASGVWSSVVQAGSPMSVERSEVFFM